MVTMKDKLIKRALLVNFVVFTLFNILANMYLGQLLGVAIFISQELCYASGILLAYTTIKNILLADKTRIL